LEDNDKLEPGDLVVVLDAVDCVLVNLRPGDICIVAEVYHLRTERQQVIVDGILLFDLRVATTYGKEVDVWYHEIKKL
jgi:hypothetical protein